MVYSERVYSMLHHRSKFNSSPHTTMHRNTQIGTYNLRIYSIAMEPTTHESTLHNDERHTHAVAREVSLSQLLCTYTHAFSQGQN